jgi:NAD-dependent dihydropyrimidine dehydrogenase PreA subunit
MEKRFKELAAEPSLYDLAENKDLCQTISQQIRSLGNDCCLMMGSPVYVSHAAPPIMHCISKLASVEGSYAVPFVTWGGASSGISLFEMARELSRKGFTILGAAKVLAVHSLMWQLENPLGAGHPNSADDKLIEQLVDETYSKMQSGGGKDVELSRLAYQSKEVHAEMEKVTLEMAKAHMPTRGVDEEICNQCEVCTEFCPTDAVTLSPYPVFGEDCVYCFNCMRTCPEGAIKADLTGVWERIRDRAAFFKERPHTQIFV